MLRSKHRSGGKAPCTDARGPNPLNAYAQSFLEWSAVHGRSAQTIETRARALRRFINWCDERDLSHPKDVTLPILERYQRYLYHYRKPDGVPLTFGSQQTLLVSLKVVLAGVNVAVFNATLGRRIDEWDRAPRTPWKVKLAGALSLVLWVSIVAAGRGIAYALPPP